MSHLPIVRASVRKKIVSAPALVVAALIASACADSTGTPAGSASQISFMVSSSSAASLSATSIPVSSDGHTLDLTGVQLTLLNAQLKPVPGAACHGDEDDDDQQHPATPNGDCHAVKVGPATIDLPLDGGLATLDGTNVPAGDYRELEVRISSVHLIGTFDAAPFDVTIPLSVRSEIDFSPPLTVVAGTPVSITVVVPFPNWLVNLDGSLVDPNSLATDPLLQAAIRARIRSSLSAFEDHDHDGHNDHENHGQGQDG
jgi:hypothetical protein